jgi:hypothetical protein
MATWLLGRGAGGLSTPATRPPPDGAPFQTSRPVPPPPGADQPVPPSLYGAPSLYGRGAPYADRDVEPAVITGAMNRKWY